MSFSYRPTYRPRVATSSNALLRVGALALAAMVAGLLFAGVLLPEIGALGLAAKTGADSWQSLPNDLKVLPLPQRSRILAADGSTIATFYAENRVYTPLSQVPKSMRDALVAIEDSRFYEHHGVDFRGLIRAAVHNSSSGSTQGGSTLTQQYVKNILLEDATTPAARAAADAPTLARKVREAHYAIELEKRWSKDQILEAYLNIAYFGEGAYGIGAAAQRFFNEPVTKLTLAQSALLAGLVQSPSADDPVHYPQTAKERRDTVLERMAQLHYIPEEQAAALEARPLAVHLASPGGTNCVGSPAPFFCDYVRRALEQDAALGATAEARLSLLNRGGLTIRTTLDPKIQQAAQAAVDKHVPNDGGKVAEAANVVEPGTGYIKAMAVDRPYDPSKSAKNHGTAENYATGGEQGFQSGSTFKIFILTAALEEGIPLSLQLHCPPKYTSTLYNGYAVANAEAAEGGTYNVVAATAKSVNTCFLKLEELTGLSRPGDIARALGLREIKAPGAPINWYPSSMLGTNSVSPLALTAAYAAYAAHGKYCPPAAILSVTDAQGHKYNSPPTKCTQVIDPAIADTVTAVLQTVPQVGTAAGQINIGRPSAGKTGTTENEAVAMYCGYVPQLASCIWMGNPAAPSAFSMKGITIAGQTYPEVFGATIAAPTWSDLMLAALQGVPVVGFAGPSPSVIAGKTVTVPDETGLSPAQAISDLQNVGLQAQVAPGPPQPLGTPAGTVGKTNPPAGASVGYGSTVTLIISNGQPVPKPSPSKKPSPKPSTSPCPKTKKCPTPSPHPTPLPHNSPTAAPHGSPPAVKP